MAVGFCCRKNHFIIFESCSLNSAPKWESYFLKEIKRLRDFWRWHLKLLNVCQSVKNKVFVKIFWSLKFEKASKFWVPCQGTDKIDYSFCSSYCCLIAKTQTQAGKLGAAGLFVYISATWRWKMKVLSEVIYKSLRYTVVKWGKLWKNWARVEIREFKSIRNKKHSAL